MVGLLMGFLASSALSCGPAVKACGPRECPFGCCDAAGSCQVGSSDAQCGSQGAACSACALAQRCNFGICSNIGQSGGPGGGNGGGTGGGVTGGGTGGGVTGGGTGGGVTGGGTGGGLTGGGTGGGVTGGGTGGGFTGGGGGGCSSANCSEGCCSNGACVRLPNNANNTTCGVGGNTCMDCAAFGTTCNGSTFTCAVPAGGGGGTGVCDGCLNPTSSACVPFSISSQSSASCGAVSNTCVTCSAGTTCQSAGCGGSAGGGPAVSNGRVRLVDGDGVGSGRLEVFMNGGWGQVCDDSFDGNLDKSPNVVCRDLGFVGALSQGNVTGPSEFFSLDRVVCDGTEARLLDCSHDDFGVEDCGASEAVFVTCDTGP